jgi:hypothetical protein
MALVVAPAAVGGILRWDLPDAVSELEATANVEVVNNTTEEHIYAVSVIWAKAENIGEFYSWNVIQFTSGGETFNAFRLGPNMVFPFALTMSVDVLNKYVARLRLHCIEGDTIYRDEYVAELMVYFGELPAGYEMLQMMGPMMAIMMLGVMSSMTRGLIPEEEAPPARVEIVAPRELPPGRG